MGTHQAGILKEYTTMKVVRVSQSEATAHFKQAEAVSPTPFIFIKSQAHLHQGLFHRAWLQINTGSIRVTKK